MDSPFVGLFLIILPRVVYIFHVFAYIEFAIKSGCQIASFSSEIRCNVAEDIDKERVCSHDIK